MVTSFLKLFKKRSFNGRQLFLKVGDEENNKMNISRRGFLKSAALTGAALAMPSGLDKMFAAQNNKPKKITKRHDDTAHITEHRILGTGKAAFEVSTLGFGMMGMTYNRSQHPDKKQCIRRKFQIFITHNQSLQYL